MSAKSCARTFSRVARRLPAWWSSCTVQARPPAVTFDVPYKDYSWMAYLAEAGFDVFSMEMTGYGRSTRPPPMNDPCNFPKAQQAEFVPA